MEIADAYCLEYLRKEEAGVYPALLFLPEDVRRDIAALQAFHLETGKIAYLVSEPLPGEIRLQWWQDVIHSPNDDNARQGEGMANPVARDLLDVIDRHDLPRAGFERYLEARQFDLYNDAMPDRTSLEACFGETESFILQMSARVFGIDDSSELADACGHGGVAIGLIRHLKLLSRDRALQKTWLPEDLLSSAGLNRAEWLSKPDSRHEMAIAAAVALANEHMEEARIAVRRLGKSNRAVFLPLAIARADSRGMNNSGSILNGSQTSSPLRQQFALWKAAIFGF